MNQVTDTSTLSLRAFEEGFDPIEDRLRANIRSTIEPVFEEELDSFPGRLRDSRHGGGVKGYRNGTRGRQITGTFGIGTVSVPRARIEDGEWRSKALPRYQRLTRTAEALIASVYLSGTNMRRVKRALFALFKGAVSKDVVSRAWRRVKADRDAWCTRSLADEDIIRLILDGTVIKTRVDRKATNISMLAALRGNGLAIQRRTVHKHCNLPGHAPRHMHEELTADYRDMIYAETAREVEKRRKAFLRKWRLKCRAVADSLEEAADRLFTFIRLAPSQWKSARTTNAIERLNEEFRRRMKTQTVLPCAETVPMLLWALLASGQIRMRKVDGWETLTQPALPMPLDFAA